MPDKYFVENTFGSMLKMLIKRTGLNQRQFGEKIGVTSQSVSEWVKGKSRPDSERLPIVAKALGVTVDELLSGEQFGQEPGQVLTGNVSSVRPNISEFYVQVPFLSIKAQAGLPAMNYTDVTKWVEETYPVFLPVVAITEKHLVIEVQGDSMEPEIKSGALVLSEAVAKDDIKYESGGVYAIIYGNSRFVVKRIKTNELTTSGTLTLWSDNEKYGQIVVPGNEIHCMWKVTYKVTEAVR